LIHGRELIHTRLHLIIVIFAAMKILTKFILKSYAGPFVLTFFIAMFVFFMMFIFKYIDDFVGKGLSFSILFELFFYFSLTTIPMALPLAILLSSLMTFGNLGEHFELTALKSAGLSLEKIMKPLIITIFVIAIAAFFFSNYILPYTNLKAGALLFDVRTSKPTLMFKEGAFNNSLEGYSIRVAKKDKDGKTLHGILIYDHTELQGNNLVLVAKSGTMEESPDKAFLLLHLHEGASYKEVKNNPQNINEKHPLIRDTFKERIIRFDLSGFKLSRTKEELFKSHAQMLNLSQLNDLVDSFKVDMTKSTMNFSTQIQKIHYPRTSKLLSAIDSTTTDTALAILPLSSMPKPMQLSIIESASSITRSSKAFAESTIDDVEIKEYSIAKYKAEWHRKFTLSVACIVLFFIGAPLGAIIRKGGLGMPVVVSVLFFITFHILSITGEKLTIEGNWPSYMGMWMATAVLFPIGVFLTYKAKADSSLFDVNVYLAPIKKLFGNKKTTDL
jgi:lipopolysaccharide export system permease protein